MSNLEQTSDQEGINLGSYTNPFTPIGIPAAPVTPPASPSEFDYISQFAIQNIGIVTNISGVPQDVGTVNVAIYPLPMPGTSLPSGQSADTPVFTGTATEYATGVYEIQTSTSFTSIPGYYVANWSFTLNGNPETTSTYIQVGQASPAYDNLPEVMKQMVEQVWVKISDIFDSPMGGPNLQMWYQTHFGRGRIAQLLYQTVQHISNMSQPSYINWTADGNGGPMFPIQQWGGLLNTALTVEVIKHLMRSYVEDPDIQGNVQARMNRRDYLARWGSILELEQQDLVSQRETFKISMMFQTQPRAMVAGGIFGNWYTSPMIYGALAARGMFRYRYFT